MQPNRRGAFQSLPLVTLCPQDTDLRVCVCLRPTADDNATIRVTNLSEDTREADLQELFRPFGAISRIYLAKDKNTGQSKVCAGLDVGPGAQACTWLC